MKWVHIACIAAGAFVVASPGVAHAADPAPSIEATADAANDARAREHFREGVALFDAKPPDYAGALSEFEAAMRDKPSWIIEQNIALALRALRRYPEAKDALEDALLRGGADIRPDTRAAMTSAIAELEPLIADLRITFRGEEDGPIPEGLVLVVDGVRREITGNEAVIRVGAGEHEIEVTSPRFTKKDSVRVAGREHALVIVRVPVPKAHVVIHADTEDVVTIDGKKISIGPFDGQVTIGKHVLHTESQINANNIWQQEFEIKEGSTAIFDKPPPVPEITAPNEESPRSPKYRRWWIEAGGSGFYTNLKFSSVLGEPAAGTNRSLYGAAFVLRAARRVSRYFAIGLTGELGTASTFNYSIAATANRASTRVDTWALGALVTFATPGDFGFVSDASIAFLAEDVQTNLPSSGLMGASSSRGSQINADGIDAAFTLDAGARYAWDRLTIGAYGFAEIHGDRSVVNAGNSAFLDDVPFRVGVRAMVGVLF